MAMFFRSAALALVLLLAASPAVAGDPSHHRTERGLVVHPRPARPAAAALSVAVAPGVTFATPFTVVAGDPGRVVRVPHYIGPDGTYDEYADLVKSINGTPCGQECSRRSLERWGYAPDD